MAWQNDLPPPIDLFVAHAPAALRAPWRWLWQLDQRMLRLAGGPSEPALAQIRLAWWRLQLSGEGDAAERRDPTLRALDDFDDGVRDGAAKAALALVDATEAMTLGGGGERLLAAGRRGEALSLPFDDAGYDRTRAARDIGRYWGLAQLAPVAESLGSDREQWEALLEEGRGLAEDAPRTVRALGLMRLHARLLHRHGERPLGPLAGLRLTAHGLTGL